LLLLLIYQLILLKIIKAYKIRKINIIVKEVCYHVLVIIPKKLVSNLAI
jgi:hypothetical protein